MKPTPTPEMIERIAKIIDKSAWQAIEDGRDALPHSLWGVRRDGARHTAAEVIAALSVPAAAVVGEPVAWTTETNLAVAKHDPELALTMWGKPTGKEPVALYREPPSAPSAPEGWQPIETAPKDGTRFLASVLNDVTVLHWHGGQKKGCWHDENSAFGYGENLPTHWRPLPAPPALGGASHE